MGGKRGWGFLSGFIICFANCCSGLGMETDDGGEICAEVLLAWTEAIHRPRGRTNKIFGAKFQI